MQYFHECATLMLVLTNAPECRGGLEGQNVAINPCPPTKDYPLFSGGPPFQSKGYVEKDSRAVQNCSLLELKG